MATIGFFASYAIWGGGEKWHYEMAKVCAEKGDECVVFCAAGGELARRLKESSLSIKIIELKIGKASYCNPIFQLKLYWKLIRAKLDAIVFNSFLDVRTAAPIAKLARVKRTIFRIGMPIVPAPKRSFLWAFRFGLDELVAISKECLSVYQEKRAYLLKGKKIAIISNAINTDLFYPPTEKRKAGPIRLGNCVRLSEQKGLPHLFRSLAIFKKIWKKDFEFHLAGCGEDEEKLKDLRSKLDLGREIYFRGHTDRPQEFYREIDILAFSSKYEGTARTILEAMASGLAVIAFKISSMEEMIEHERDGLLITPFNEEEFAMALLRLAQNENLRHKMGEEGFKKVKGLYNQKKIYPKWRAYLHGGDGRI